MISFTRKVQGMWFEKSIEKKCQEINKGDGNDQMILFRQEIKKTKFFVTMSCKAAGQGGISVNHRA